MIIDIALSLKKAKNAPLMVNWRVCPFRHEIETEVDPVCGLKNIDCPSCRVDDEEECLVTTFDGAPELCPLRKDEVVIRGTRA